MEARGSFEGLDLEYEKSDTGSELLSFARTLVFEADLIYLLIDWLTYICCNFRTLRKRGNHVWISFPSTSSDDARKTTLSDNDVPEVFHR